MKIEDVTIWEAFRAIALHGNFSKASKALRIGVPQISKRLAKLEEQLGVRLFQRSTRVVTLTEEGRNLLPKVTALLEDLEEIEASFEDAAKLAGTIRITSVPFVAQRLLVPIIAKFRKLHPGIDVELELSESIMNLIEANYDLAIRIDDEPDDSALIYRKLAANRLVLCASPAYLKANPSPLKTPDDLRKHELLALATHDGCAFRDGSRLRDFAKSKRIVCESGWFLTELALAGEGVLVRSVWDVHAYLRSGKLVPVLKNHPLEDFGHIYSVVPSRRYLAPRVRAFLDFVAKESAGWSRSETLGPRGEADLRKPENRRARIRQNRQ